MIKAIRVRTASPRDGVPVTEYSASCGLCRETLPRRASFTTLREDYIACAGCGKVNRVERPR